MQNNPVQPSDKLLDELAKRVAYAGLQQIEKDLTAVKTGGAINSEKLDALGNVVAAASACFWVSGTAGPSIDD